MTQPFQIGPKQNEWLQYLEQHPEQQMRKRLGKKETDGTIKTCCLGVMLLMTENYKWQGDFLFCIDSVSEKYSSPFYLNNYEELGLFDSKGSLKNPITDKTKDSLIHQYDSLSLMNDYGWTWPEIAAAIRAAPQDYFSRSQ